MNATESGPARAIALFWRRRLVVLAAVVLGVGVAAVIALNRTPSYEASSQVLLARQDLAYAATGTSELPYDDQQEAIITQTQATIADSPPVISGTLAALGIRGESVAAFRQANTVAVVTGTDLLQFTASAGARADAARIANTWARSYLAVRRGLAVGLIDQALAATNGAGVAAGGIAAAAHRLDALRTSESANATLVNRATATDITPGVPKELALGLIVGLLTGLIVAVLADGVDPRIRDVAEIADAVGGTVLGRLPAPAAARGGSSAQLAVRDQPEAAYARAAREIRSRLEVALAAVGARSVLVARPAGGRVGSTAATDLAYAYEQLGYRVLLVDADLQMRTVSRTLDVVASPGLTDVVAGRVELLASLVGVPVQTGSEDPQASHVLGVLPAGTATSPGAELAELVSFKQVLRALLSGDAWAESDPGAHCDLVVVDAGALTAATLATVSHEIDAVVLELSRGLARTHVREYAQALSGFNLVGLVQRADRRLGSGGTARARRARSPSRASNARGEGREAERGGAERLELDRRRRAGVASGEAS